MILQRDVRIIEKNKQIKKYGCYFFALLWYGNKLENYPLGVDEILSLYHIFIDHKFMREDCFIDDPVGILKSLNVAVQWFGWKDKDYQCSRGEYEILVFTRRSEITGALVKHFVAGNGNGIVTYDSWGESVTVQQGRLASKRILRVAA